MFGLEKYICKRCKREFSNINPYDFCANCIVDIEDEIKKEKKKDRERKFRENMEDDILVCEEE